MSDYLVFFPTTGAVRVFDSFNLAQASYPRQPIIASAQDVPEQMALEWYEQLFEYLDAEGKHFNHGSDYVTSNEGRKTFPKVRKAESWSANEVRQAFWELAITCGNRVTKFAPNNENSKRRKGRATGYRVDLARANEVLADATLKMPTQARAIIEYLVAQEFDHYTREEVQKFCMTVAFFKGLNTTQDPWRVWRYYCPLLTQIGVLR